MMNQNPAGAHPLPGQGPPLQQFNVNWNQQGVAAIPWLQGANLSPNPDIAHVNNNLFGPPGPQPPPAWVAHMAVQLVTENWGYQRRRCGPGHG